tara:strand:+ start:505 stop:1083 length:579 start_codon:yes stop_codon:yes gene_type:complete
MKKHILRDYIYHSEIKDHLKVKNFILNQIEKNNKESLEVTNSYFTDSIDKLDWNESKDSERPWVKFFLPSFTNAVNEFLKNSLYCGIQLKEIWYQQYLNNGTHGWHIHGHHYTGVYYLEFPNKSSKTELIFPFNNKSQTINVSEGDIIIFPSHIIHRGLPNQSKRKTIISFNFDIVDDKLGTDKLTNLRSFW